MTRASRSVPLLLAVAVAACRESRSGASIATVERADGPSAVASCPVRTEALELADGTHVYIEPEAVAAVGSGVLVAGVPSYTWEVGTARNAIMTTRDRYLAAWLGEDDVTLVEKPVDVRVGDVRIAHLGEGRWATLFAEIGPDSLPMTESLQAVWYGEHDGRRWTRVEPLPLPPERRLDFASSSALVRAGSRLAWVVAARRDGFGDTSLRFYQRDRGGWSSEEVSEVWAETTALAYDPSGLLWLAVVSEDPDLPGWQQSLRLYTRNGGWRLGSRATVAEEGTRIRGPGLTPLRGGMAVSWRAVSNEGSIGFARIGVGIDGGGRLVEVDRSAEEVAPLAPPDGVPAWVVHHVNPITQLSELRLVRATSTGVSVVHSLPNPFLGFFGALATARGEALVVGPDFDPDPTRPTVRSLILRLSTSCT